MSVDNPHRLAGTVILLGAAIMLTVAGSSAHAQIYGAEYLDIQLELVEMNVTPRPESGSELIQFEFKVTNLGRDRIDGSEYSWDLEVTDGDETLHYGGVYYTGGPMIQACPEYLNDVGARLITTWRMCFEVPVGFEPVTLLIFTDDLDYSDGFTYSDDDAHAVAFGWDSTCGWSHQDYCAPYTLDGSIPLSCWVDDSISFRYACAHPIPDKYKGLFRTVEDWIEHRDRLMQEELEPPPIESPQSLLATDRVGLLNVTYHYPDDPILYGLAYWSTDNRDVLLGEAFLNDTLTIPDDLVVVFDECGTSNAFYSPTQRKITLCYELIETVALYAYDDPATESFLNITEYTSSVIRWIFMHELGHALVDVYDLPITGQEEDAVDQFATVLLVDEDPWIPMVAASAYLYTPSDAAFWSQHSLNLQRHYDTLCLLHGHGYFDTIGSSLEALIPDERALWCSQEYDDAVHAWDTLLSDYLKQ